MNILVISEYYHPEPFRITDICEAMVQKGHTVTVLTKKPDYPKGDIYPGYEGNEHRKEVVNGVRILRCDARPRMQGTINLGRSYLSYMHQDSQQVKRLKGNYDVVFVYQMSPVLMGIPGIKAKKKFDIPMVLYCLDLWPESIKDVFKSEKAPLFVLTKYASKYIYKKSDLILTKCPSFIDYLVCVCSVNRKKTKVLPEHAEDTYLSVEESPINNGIIDFMFLGNIGISQDCDVIVKAVKKLNPKLPFKVHFVGDGSYLEELKTLADSEGVSSKIQFHGRHPLSEMPEYYKLADVCVLTLSNKTAIGLTVPAKLTGYMAASRPVVAAISGDSREVINDSHCGYCVEAGDINGLALIMLRCIKEPKILHEMGENGREYFKRNYTKDIFINRLENDLCNCIKDKNK